MFKWTKELLLDEKGDRMRRQIFATFAITALILAIGCGGGEAQSTAKTNPNSVLNFTLKNLDGEAVDLSQFHGKVVILDVWDTWCPPCRKGIPEFVQLYDQYKDQGLQIVGIALGRKGLPEVKKFVADYNVSYLNVIGEPIIYDIFGKISGIPTTFVIDKQGKIHNKYVGYRPKSVFENDVKQLLAS